MWSKSKGDWSKKIKVCHKMPNSQILNQQKIHNIFVKMSLKNKMRIFCFYKNKNKKKFHKKLHNWQLQERPQEAASVTYHSLTQI